MAASILVISLLEWNFLHYEWQKKENCELKNKQTKFSITMKHTTYFRYKSRTTVRSGFITLENFVRNDILLGTPHNFEILFITYVF